MRRIDWRIVIGVFVLNTICLFFYRQLDFVAYGIHRPALLTFLEEGVGGLAGFVIFPLAYLLCTRFPLVSPAWPRNLLAQLAGLCLISVVHTTLIALFRAVLFPLFGFGTESYGSLPVRYPMEFAHLFIYYWLGVCLIYFFHEIRFARERELRQAHLETSLAEAQLQNLRLQLEPHFLFNALNAISAAIYEDPRVADEMIGRLSELLRHLLTREPAQQVSLTQEIETLQLYLRVMQARFEHRLKVTIDVDDEVRHALVPQLLLQPLVENAIRHGMDPVTFEVDIAIAARRTGETVSLAVSDHGPGLDPVTPLREGLGLRNTRERLERLYHQQQNLSIRNATVGAIVELQFPFRK